MANAVAFVLVLIRLLGTRIPEVIAGAVAIVGLGILVAGISLSLVFYYRRSRTTMGAVGAVMNVFLCLIVPFYGRMVAGDAGLFRSPLLWGWLGLLCTAAGLASAAM